jgi:hypothetical protein
MAGFVTLAWICSSPGALVPGLAVVPASGCCDCGGSFNVFNIGSATGMSGLEASGACGEVRCTWSPPETEGCRLFELALVAAGNCHVTATASDGRQVSTDFGVTVAQVNCCGNIYRFDPVPVGTTNGTVSITFPDAVPDGGI